MSYIARTESSESISSLKRQRKSIQNEVTMERTDPHESEMLTAVSKVSDDGRISEIDFIKSVAKIFYEREKKEKVLPIYDWMSLRSDLESKNACLTHDT